MPSATAAQTDPLLEGLTQAQQEAVHHAEGPLLIIAGAGTGKTSVITRRIAWLIQAKRARPEEILALTFTDKASFEMRERVDLLLPYGYVDVVIKTFHAFGDQLVRDHAPAAGLSPQFRVLSQPEQRVFMRRHIFDFPLEHLRPLHDPTRYLEALLAVFARAKDEAASPEEFLKAAGDSQVGEGSPHGMEIARCYEAYQRALKQEDAVDFGDQVLLAVRLLEEHSELRRGFRKRFKYILVDEFQDTNYSQFRMLQLIASPTSNVTVVGDDDQSIYKWRGAALSNVIKFLEHYTQVRTVVLTDNFRSGQSLLDCSYRLIRFNDPDRLEVRNGIDKRLKARREGTNPEPKCQMFDTVSSEADWVARQIRDTVESGLRTPKDHAILVRSNRDAEIFLRALNVAGVPWQFSGASGLFFREESKMLLSCLKVLGDPDDNLSWYHVASSPLYRVPMRDLAAVLAAARSSHMSFRQILESWDTEKGDSTLTPKGQETLTQFRSDVDRLLELSRMRSAGQVLYQWLKERGFLTAMGSGEGVEEAIQLQTVGRFFERLQDVERLIGGQLPEIMQHMDLFQALGNEPVFEDDAWADRVQVLTIHKAKGLEFPVVFLVSLLQGRFPTVRRREVIELPAALVKDILPSGDYHLQEERRLFYVGMTRAREELYMTAAHDYGGKSVRKISQFVLEALQLTRESLTVNRSGSRQRLERSRSEKPLKTQRVNLSQTLRLNPHGVDDYITCPLKYRYSHVLRLQAMRHHLVVYGAALHTAIEQFFKRRLDGGAISLEELYDVFESCWSSQGFLTREHETLRLAQGKRTLERFYRSQQEAPENPSLIEEKFQFSIGKKLVVVGRWDRVDCTDKESVIIDYKSSEVREEKAANRRARESLQMVIYALAWKKLHGELPTRVELRFLETGVTGTAVFDEQDMAKAQTRILDAAMGIRAGDFQAKPQEFSCKWCAYQEICPSAYKVG